MAETAPAGEAVKKATGVFKRVPKWAWIASAGVVGGVLYMRSRAGSGEVVDKSEQQDATAPGDYGQTGQQFASGYVDVPYSSSPVQSQDSNNVDLPGIIGALGALIPPAPDAASITEGNAALIGAIAPLLGGGAPQSSATVAPPAAPTAVAPVAPQVAPRPTPVPSAPQTARGTMPQYMGSLPAGVFLQDTGARKGLRYVIRGNQRWYESKLGKGDWGQGGKIAR